jgi:hypothetical protein
VRSFSNRNSADIKTTRAFESPTRIAQHAS